MPTIAAEPATRTDAYRREARRLRCRYAGRPGELHASLKRLAGTGATTAVSPGRPPARPQRVVATPRYPGLEQGEPARRFAAYLAGQQVASPVLRYSRRLELLRAARRFGVGRFEANLLIAVMLERRRSATAERAGVERASAVPQILLFCLVQGGLLAAAWWALLR